MAVVCDQAHARHHVRPLLDSILSRGPDDARHVQGDWFTLGFCRLSIMVLGERGRQPVATEAADIHLVFNGEIYNFREIQARLTSDYGISSSSEAEALLHLYQKLGSSFVQELDGDYAIAIFDSRSRTCFAFRDPFGVKPLYYANIENSRTWVLSSHIKAFFQHPDFSTELDPITLMERRVVNFWSSDRTCFSGIRQLPPGHRLKISLSRSSGCRTTEHEIVSLSTDHDEVHGAVGQLDAEEIATRCGDAIRHSVRKRVEHSDVFPVVLALSGGIDSSLMAAIAGGSSEQLTALTVFDADECLDQEYASLVSREIGLRHETYKIELDQFLEEFPRVVLEMAGPAPSYTPYFLARAARQYYPSAKVVLCGEGADEFFIGYRLLLEDEYVRSKSLSALRAFAVEETMESPLLQRIRHWEAADREDAWLSLIDMFQREQLVNLHLVPFDHGMMAHGIECRVPFLDLEVVRLARKLPARVRALGNTTKILLRIVLAQTLGRRHRRLSRRLLSRPSSPAFLSTLRCRNWLRQFVRERLSKAPLQRSKLAALALDDENLFWLACVTTIFLKHRGNIEGMRFDDLAAEVFSSATAADVFEPLLSVN